MAPSTWSRSGVTGTDSLGASYLLSISFTRGSSRVFLGSLFDVTYWDSLSEQLTALEETVVANHLAPRRAWENVSFDSLETLERSDESDGPNPASLSHSGLYRYKRGTAPPVTDST